jgi:ABC-type transporter Mla subunit MlaD
VRRRPGSSVAANPLLVGAVTTLVVVVAVFLSYNANKGLPFVPTTELKVLVDNGANLLPGNEVREGGFRVGLVSDMKPRRLSDGTTGAEVTLRLDEGAGALPKDSTIDLRPRSVLGLKYVEITRGKSRETFADGDTIPASQATYPVELADLYEIYDEPTRDGVRRATKGFGGGLTGRGVGINRTIEGLPPLLTDLEPVARSLALPSTDLRRFVREIGDTVRTLRPVADRYAHGFEAGADVFEAWSRFPDRLGQAIEKAGPTLETSVRSQRVQQPFLRRLARFSGALDDAAQTLPTTLPRIIPALELDTRAQRRAPLLNRPLTQTLAAVRRLATAPETSTAFRGLGSTVAILNPLLQFVGPYITVCNYWNYAWTHLGEHLTEPDPTGFSQRVMLMQPPRTRDPRASQLGSIGAVTPANGEEVVSGSPYFLHVNAYGAAINRDGTADCEPGQRGYIERAAAFSPKELKIVVDPRIPGSQGTTFKGRDAVPPGQTFRRAPGGGPNPVRTFDPRQDP